VLFNNGYLVQSNCISANKMYQPIKDCYRGVGHFTSWPLDDYDDNISKALTNEAFDKWFAYQNVLEVVPEKEYLYRYIKHCDELGILTTIIMIETPLDTQIAQDILKVVEVLGFDLMNSVHFSYLAMDIDYIEDECASFLRTIKKLNSNGLCDSIEDIYDHIIIRNNLLLHGINLEYASWGPFPARLNIVELE